MQRFSFILCVSLLAGLLLLPGSCSQRKLPALGSSSDLTIVTNMSPDDEVVRLLKSSFSATVVTVEEEERYSFEVEPASRLHKHRDSRNLVLLADLSKRDRLRKKVREVLGKRGFEQLEASGADYRVLSNIEALGQTMAVVAGVNRESLLDLLRRKGGELYAVTDSVVTERTGDIVYIVGYDTSMERYVLSKYGWMVRIPKTYRVAEEEKGRVIKVVSGEDPARLLLVHWTAAKDGKLDPKQCLDLRARLAWAYYDEDQIDRKRTSVADVFFQGRRALKITGVWQNEKYVIGGPFITYCFIEKGRLYLLDGVVFAPGMDKGPWLRQVEAIMLTFKDDRKEP